MVKLFEFLWHGCWHHWEETDRKGVVGDDNTVIGYAVFCKCNKCGTPKRFNLYDGYL